MRISELADELGVAPSTVRYYERIGLVPSRPRTPSGYRNYDDADAARLLFVTRAKRIGLTLEQIAEVLPIWDGVNCAVTHEQITQLVEAKRAEVLGRIRDLEHIADVAGIGQAFLNGPEDHEPEHDGFDKRDIRSDRRS